MSGDCSNTAVHRLFTTIHRFLRPYTELSNISPEIRKQLLISLSQIINQIQRWIDQSGDGCSNSVESDSLTDVFSILIPLLNVDNKYIQHSVGNLFLVILEYLLACGSNWDGYIRLLCISFESGFGNVLLHHSQSLSENSELNFILNDISWNGVAGIVRVLRGVLRLSKGEDDAKFVVILLKSLSNSLSKLPWDILKDVRFESSTDVNSCSGQEILFLKKDGSTNPKILFMGNLVQLLCSLVGLIASAEDGGDPINRAAPLLLTCELVPNILSWCVAEEQTFNHGNTLTFFRHKILMLMIRLTFHMQLDNSILLQWLQFLHKYFQDLLCRPLVDLQCGHDDSLEGSPFLSSLYDHEDYHLSSRHLQRQAIFLFARCCLTLAGPGESADLNVPCKRTSSLFECDSNTSEVCFARKKGVSELYSWLQAQVSPPNFFEKEIHLEKCVEFATSFIKLYMHEDDMLFEVLLQMLSIPFSAKFLLSKNGSASPDVVEDALFLISRLFNPLLLFHVFLAELQYDHQLLLDYLISKDTGSKCAEYLLRCLRILCNSWSLFVQLLVDETCVQNCQKSSKRKRTFLIDSSEKQVLNPSPCEQGGSPVQCQDNYARGIKFFEFGGINFEDTKACLLSLKCALRKLHSKKLFPYNPELLIQRYANPADCLMLDWADWADTGQARFW